MLNDDLLDDTLVTVYDSDEPERDRATTFCAECQRNLADEPHHPECPVYTDGRGHP